jgi:molybdopterin molybdotransferase
MAINLEQAFSLIAQNISCVGYETVSIEDSIGRIVSKDIKATHNIPRFNNSAMDGYGIKLNGINGKIEVVDTILAGGINQTQILDNQCVKIMTGAKVPSSVEAIVPQELVEVCTDNLIKINSTVKRSQHIRFVGEDIKVGEKLLYVGEEISFAKVAILASQGITHIEVYKKPKVAVFASGEELRYHGDKDIKEYQLYNSNTPTLVARAKELGCDICFEGMVKDSVDNLKKLILNSLDVDFIITSGGVSVGEADFTKESFSSLGAKTIFDGVDIKPGKPTVLSRINNTIVLNLPGNPLAASLIFELFGKLVVQHLKGSKDCYHNVIKAKIYEKFKNNKGRTTIITGFFDGEFFTPSDKKGAGMVSVLSGCNSMIILNDKVDYLYKSDEVLVLPINWSFFADKKKSFLTNSSSHTIC